MQLAHLVEAGNTVIVAEHDMHVIAGERSEGERELNSGVFPAVVGRYLSFRKVRIEDISDSMILPRFGKQQVMQAIIFYVTSCNATQKRLLRRILVRLGSLFNLA